MTLESPAYVISADSHSAELFRRTAGTMLSGTGVVGSSDLQVEQNGSPNMSVNVLAGQVWVPGTLGATSGMGSNLNAQTAYGLPSSFTSQGPYQAYQDAPANLAIAAADPTNPRIDLVVAYVEDAEYAGSSNQPVLGVITGTPGVSPSPPSAPASAVVLAQVAVAANATSIVTANITDERPSARLLGYVQAPHTRVYRTATWSTGLGPVIFNYDTVTYDEMNCWGSNEFTCPVAGWYRVFAQISASASASAQWVGATLYHNSTAVSTGPTPFSVSGTEFIYGTVNDTVECAAGDTLSIYESASTAGLTGNTGSTLSYATFDFIGQ